MDTGSDFLDGEVELNDPIIELQSIDPRLQQLSYSSLLTLHSCPRKYELYKKQSKRDEIDPEDTSNVTFAFGHVVGEGIQQVLMGLSEDQILWNMFLGWHADLFDENIKQQKSFWYATIAVQKFIAMRESGFLQDWELVYWEGKPAVELAFLIHLPDGFVYRGFVDAVLRNTVTGEVMVLEVKTTSAAVLRAAQYKNSAQAIGYSIVLDVLFPSLSSYEVLYLPYKTKDKEYEQLSFTKSYLQRALWIRELLLDVELIKMYHSSGCFPMHGESCLSFYRECEYFNICTLDTSKLAKPFRQSDADKIENEHSKFSIQVTIDALIDAQIAKSNQIQAEQATHPNIQEGDNIL